MSNEQEQPTEMELLKRRAKLLGITHSGNIGVETLRQKINEKLAEVDEGETSPAPPTGSESDNSLPEQIDTTQNQEGSENFDDDIEEESSDNSEVNGFTAAAQIAEAKVSAPPTSDVIKPIEPLKVDAIDPSVSRSIGQPVKAKEGKRLSLRQHLYNTQMRLVRVQITNLDPKKADLDGEILSVANKHLGTIKQFVPYGEVTDDGWHIPYIIYKELERRRFLHIRTTKDKRTSQVKVTKSWAKEFSLTILPPLTQGELAQLATAQAAAGSIDGPSETL